MAENGLEKKLQDAYNEGFKAGQKSMASRLMEWVQGGGYETEIKMNGNVTLNKRTATCEGKEYLLRYTVMGKEKDGTEEEQ